MTRGGTNGDDVLRGTDAPIWLWDLAHNSQRTFHDCWNPRGAPVGEGPLDEPRMLWRSAIKVHPRKVQVSKTVHLGDVQALQPFALGPVMQRGGASPLVLSLLIGRSDREKWC